MNYTRHVRNIRSELGPVNSHNQQFVTSLVQQKFTDALVQAESDELLQSSRAHICGASPEALDHHSTPAFGVVARCFISYGWPFSDSEQGGDRSPIPKHKDSERVVGQRQVW